MDDFNHTIEVNLSGGGYRAAAFDLGALLYLVHSGLNRKVVFISSVSGGSITNAHVAQECDFAKIGLEDFKARVAAPLAKKIAHEGLGGIFGFLIKRKTIAAAGVGCIAGLVGAALAQMWLVLGTLVVAAGLGLGPGWRLVGWWVSAWLRKTFFSRQESRLGDFAQGPGWRLVGRWVSAWLRKTFFPGKEWRLGDFAQDNERTVDHQFCATDLERGTPFYFSTKGGGRVYSEAYGRGSGNQIPLWAAVRASAAFPPVFPPLRLRLEGPKWLKLPDPYSPGKPEEASQDAQDRPSAVYLSDGGVWNNLGSDWSRREFRDGVLTAEIAWMQKVEGMTEACAVVESPKRVPMGAVQLMADASAPQTPWQPSPVFPLVSTTLRVVNITYQSGLAARIGDVDSFARKRMWQNPPRWTAPGSDVEIPNWVVEDFPGSSPPLAIAARLVQLPGEMAKRWLSIGRLPHWETGPDNYRAELKAIERNLGDLYPTEKNSKVETHLVSLGKQTTLRLIVHGYLMAREAFAVVFYNAPPPATGLDKQFFQSLLD